MSNDDIREAGALPRATNLLIVHAEMPPGTAMLVPVRRPNESDEELAKRCVLVKNIGDPMIEPKPLSAEERTEILKQFGGPYPADREAHLHNAVQTIEQLLAAEAYWREAVKNAKAFTNTSGGEYADYCAFCGVSDSHDHKPDCPWVKAQE